MINLNDLKQALFEQEHEQQQQQLELERMKQEQKPKYIKTTNILHIQNKLETITNILNKLN